MERTFYTDDFEQLLKEKADQFRMYPSRRVWHSIYNNLHPSRRWPSFVMSIFLITSLIVVGHLNTSDNSSLNKGVPLITGSDYNTSKTHISTNNSSYGTNNKDVNSINTSSPDLIASNQLNNPRTGNTSSLVNETTLTTTFSVKVKDITTKSSKDRTKDIPLKTNDNNSKQLLNDLAGINEKSKSAKKGKLKLVQEGFVDEDESLLDKNSTSISTSLSIEPTTEGNNDIAKTELKKLSNPETQINKQDEKSWIENFAFQNKPSSSKWKDRLFIEFYVTPAVNYRKLSTESKGSSTPFATTGDINRSISQKPGLGIETGLGLSYAFAKNLRLNAGVQFNYTNYNINADKTNHPILTTILMTDPNTGYSYAAPRTSSIANTYNDKALQPVVLHNRTYQVSIPVGLSYKLSSHKNVEWFAGATVQPSYIFGGKAHLISADLKSYVSDPSSIRNWNLNLGFETYMNYKVGAYNLQVGPQFRYQVYSTYRKGVALIEKPYAVGLKVGIVKGF